MIYLSGVWVADMPVISSPTNHGHLPQPGQVWATDNGRFAKPHAYTDESYLAWLDSLREFRDDCLFATVPDVVGDAVTTLLMSGPMYRPIRDLGYRVALVAQDGLERLPEMVPWDDFDALFIGGTTEFKLGPDAEAIAAEAKRRGKWLHMGRVNSLRRMKYAESIGCDSADGTAIKFKPSVREPEVRSWVRHVKANPSIWRAP